MRLGLFGGTFDPVHLGHLRSAEEVKEEYALDEVCFVPCGVPPHRSGRPGAAPHHRLEMVRLAVAARPGLGVSDIEVTLARVPPIPSTPCAISWPRSGRVTTCT